MGRGRVAPKTTASTLSLRGSTSQVAPLLLVALLSACGAFAQTTTVRVDPSAPLAGVGPVPREMVGLNMPVHTNPRQVALHAVTPPGTNGNWEALRALNVGLIRQWVNAPECGLHDLDLPRDAPGDDTEFEEWLRAQLAADSANWAAFDDYMRGLCGLGDGVRIMLNLPVPPVWLGPFRHHDRHAGELVDLRSGEIVGYDRFVEWSGLDANRIGDAERFERLRRRFALFTELLVAHVRADPLLREHATMLTLGNETDSGGEIVQNSVRWRMWVYGREANARFNAGQPIRPIDEGVLQGLYFAMHDGARSADPEGTIALGGPETSWAHRQFERDGRFWYLDWFIDGHNGVRGIGRDRIDLVTWHNYGFDYDYASPARQLFEAYDRPTYLTEYNATLGGHGMNFMQRGAQTVAKVAAELAVTPGAAGAAFFKAAGGGFGAILSRETIWRTGAYFALKLVGDEIVGGRPVRCSVRGGAADTIGCLAVRRDDGSTAVLLFNESAEAREVRLRLPGERPWRITRIELPVAEARNDYRDVRADEIVSETLSARPAGVATTLAPHGVVVAVTQ
ncbi:MAG: hypothetical protein ACOX9R_14985 [Armatimonadota bacterium]